MRSRSLRNLVHFNVAPQGEENANEKEGGQRKGWGRGQGRGRGRGQYHHHNNRGETSTAAAGNPGMGEAPTVAKQQPPGPRMPDGTRGFAMGRGKPVAVNTMWPEILYVHICMWSFVMCDPRELKWYPLFSSGWQISGGPVFGFSLCGYEQPMACYLPSLMFFLMDGTMLLTESDVLFTLSSRLCRCRKES